MTKKINMANGTMRLSTLLFLLAVLFNLSNAYAQPDGKKLFKSNCSSCHAASTAKLVGPGLQDVTKRWTDKSKLYAWIKNSPEFLKTGDAYANKLYEDYNKSPMSIFPDLKDEEIDAIIAYVDKGGDAAAAAPAAGATGDAAAPVVEKESNTTFYILIGLAVAFLILFAVLRGVNKSLKKIANEKKGLPEDEELTAGQSVKRFMRNNKFLVIIIIILLVVAGLKDTFTSLMSVGVYEGYAPEQPINFSHKIHAGDNKINCVYCHSASEKSRNAGIPSANVCMNCHKAISKGAIAGETEIAKIYKALDYDPATQTYGNNPTPIKWIKVHNLPDLAYFNHSQHVVVGGVECQSCHGEVEKMDVIKQNAPLTMGWCIDCHRKTEVKMDGGYYKEIHSRLTDDLKKKFAKDKKVTVEELGGLECAKCHY